MYAASVYAAYRTSGVTVMIEEIADMSGFEVSRLWRSYKVLVKNLGLHIPILHPEDFVRKCSKHLKIGRETVNDAILLFKPWIDGCYLEKTRG